METIDRWFPVGWIGFYLLLPVSGWATVMFGSWVGPGPRLGGPKVVTCGRSRGRRSRRTAIGPAYIGAAAALHWLLRTSPEDSLVVLTRASYAVSVALGLLLVGTFVRRLVAAPPIVSIAAQFSLAAMVFAAGTWHWSDVPWSHFFAMALVRCRLCRAIHAAPATARACGSDRAAARLAVADAELRIRSGHSRLGHRGGGDRHCAPHTASDGAVVPQRSLRARRHSS